MINKLSHKNIKKNKVRFMQDKYRQKIQQFGIILSDCSNHNNNNLPNSNKFQHQPLITSTKNITINTINMKIDHNKHLLFGNVDDGKQSLSSSLNKSSDQYQRNISDMMNGTIITQYQNQDDNYDDNYDDNQNGQHYTNDKNDGNKGQQQQLSIKVIRQDNYADQHNGFNDKVYKLPTIHKIQSQKQRSQQYYQQLNKQKYNNSIDTTNFIQQIQHNLFNQTYGLFKGNHNNNNNQQNLKHEKQSQQKQRKQQQQFIINRINENNNKNIMKQFRCKVDLTLSGEQIDIFTSLKMRGLNKQNEVLNTMCYDYDILKDKNNRNKNYSNNVKDSDIYKNKQNINKSNHNNSGISKFHLLPQISSSCAINTNLPDDFYNLVKKHQANNTFKNITKFNNNTIIKNTKNIKNIKNNNQKSFRPYYLDPLNQQKIQELKSIQLTGKKVKQKYQISRSLSNIYDSFRSHRINQIR